jgi:mannose/fructose/N-acetylgalactosamine-specific phosphotransferase system component IID
VSPTVIWAIAIGLGVSILGGLAAMIVVVKLPKDYFSRPERKKSSKGNLGRKIGKIVKNIAGVLLIAGGVVLMLPGIPGPGVVVLLLGLAITDIPGKHKLIVKIAKKPAVMRSMNKVRRRFHRPDLATP